MEKVRYDLRHLAVVNVLLVGILIAIYIIDKQSNILQKMGSNFFSFIKG